MGRMDLGTVERAYPLTFRQEEAKVLGEHLRHRHSVDLVGMKRVGISNFLRYFLYHEDVKKTFISSEEKHFFIPIDLNDLIERELYPFWTLTFKRLLDEVEKSSLSVVIQQKIATLFLSSIQSKDLFLVLDGIRQSINLIVQADLLPTMFFLRFDRIKDVVTPEFFDNLQGLRDATSGQLSYVFTSFRSLDMLSPQAFNTSDLVSSYHVMYLKPATAEDIAIIAQQYMKRYQLTLASKQEATLFQLVGGNVQYLQLALVLLHEQQGETKTIPENFQELLMQDERMTFLSEELWESLTEAEKQAIQRVCLGKEPEGMVRKTAPYILDTGIVQPQKNTLQVFSPLFKEYVISQGKNVPALGKGVVFSKKEHLLFTLLERQVGQICERDDIIEGVWPEYKEFGVSDWSIDRLVARVRSKLKKQASPYEIRTIRTRGYMLTERG